MNKEFNLETVQILLDEIEFFNDTKEELEEELLNASEDMQFFAKLYNDYNKQISTKKVTLREYELELEEINNKQKRLEGRISKKDSERRNFLENEIKNLKVEIENDKNNKLDSKKSVEELTSKNPSLESSRKISELNSKIKNNENELKDIYEKCTEKIQEYDTKINAKKSEIVVCVTNNDMSLLESLSVELTKLIEEKNEKYFDYKKISDLIEKNGIKIEEKATINLSQIEPEVEIENPTIEKNDDLEPLIELNDNTEENEIEEPLDLEDAIVNETEKELTDEEIKEKMAKAAEIVREREAQKKLNEEKTEHQKITEEDKRKMEEAVKIVEENAKNNADEKVKKEPFENNERIFTDENRIDEDHRWMSASNAYNTNYIDISEPIIEDASETKEEKSIEIVEPQPEIKPIEQNPQPEEKTEQEEQKKASKESFTPGERVIKATIKGISKVGKGIIKGFSNIKNIKPGNINELLTQSYELKGRGIR